MSFLLNAVKKSLFMALATTALASCKESEPDAPAPTPVVVTPAGDPAQYGTPFANVPNREDAVIYQVNMRAFSAGGNFAGVTARLDSIKALRVNVLYLMPIYPVGTDRKSVNSPYCVKDYSAVGAEFGTLADLRTLVDGAHARGMSVMLDWVPNHTSWDHPWITAHPDWYKKDASGNIVAPTNGSTTYSDVAQLDFSSNPMRLAQIAAMRAWVFTANIDGFRCDYADYQPDDYWVQVINSLRSITTHKLLLLNEGSRSSNYTSGFDYNFGFGFYGGLKSVYKNGTAATNLDAYNTSDYVGTSTTQQIVRYTTNHDVNGSDGTPVSIYGGNAAAMSAFVIASCYKGVPFVYNGQEAGMTTPITFPFTSVKVQWGLHNDVKKAYVQLLTARAASPALQHGTPVSYSASNVCAFTKTFGSSQALVLVNVRSSVATYNVPTALANTTWTDALQGGTASVGTQVSLPAYGYMVLTK
ncbi:MAG: alpha-amylase family glycosyl hydrolase [Janthinobacterium lividum]